MDGPISRVSNCALVALWDFNYRLKKINQTSFLDEVRGCIKSHQGDAR